MSERLAATLEGPDRAPVVALGTSIGTNQGLWDRQAPVLRQRFRLLRFEMRGHGTPGAQSPAPRGPYTIAELGTDTTAPTLVIAATEDPATPPWHGAQLASAIPGARLTVVRGAAHLANYEAPGEITAALQAHLAPLCQPGGRPPGAPRMRSARAVVRRRHTGRSPGLKARFAGPVTIASP